MKIGVFGDSFADKGSREIWWNYLQIYHGHEVTCHGAAGSSILYSTNLIEQTIKEYDFVIWCLSCPGRFSLKSELTNKWTHVPQHGLHKDKEARIYKSNPDLYKKLQVLDDFKKYIYNLDDDILVGKAIVHHMLSKYSNLMIIPCFLWPLNDYNFNLWDLSYKELEKFFPNKTGAEIFAEYQDRRQGHLSKDNNIRLAELVNANINPGIFQTAYHNFKIPLDSLDQILEKI